MYKQYENEGFLYIFADEPITVFFYLSSFFQSSGVLLVYKNDLTMH